MSRPDTRLRPAHQFRRLARYAAAVVIADQVTKLVALQLPDSRLLHPAHNPGLSLQLVDVGPWLEMAVAGSRVRRRGSSRGGLG